MTDEGRGYDEVLAAAQAAGYAEADPAGDVEGHDAVNKLVILARLAFGVWLDPADVATIAPAGRSGRRPARHHRRDGRRHRRRDRLRSRISGAYTVVNYGVRPLGALAGGALGSWIGLRATLWIATAGALLGVPLAAAVADPRAPGAAGAPRTAERLRASCRSRP